MPFQATSVTEKHLATSQDDELQSTAADPAPDLIRRELLRADDLLARLVTLNAILTGGAVCLLVEETLGRPIRAAAIVLCIALACGIKGALVRVNAETEVVLQQKRRWLEGSAAALLIGLILAVGGILMR
jgi:hypothetical protein